MISASAGIHPDAPRVVFGVIAYGFQHFPGTFQKEAVLGIHRFRFSRVKAKEGRIKRLSVLWNASGFDIVGMLQQSGINAGTFEFLVREMRDGFNPIAEVFPEALYVVGARKTPGHTNDSNVI